MIQTIYMAHGLCSSVDREWKKVPAILGPYEHVYGGTAFDLNVTKEEFSFLTGIPIDQLDGFPCCTKIWSYNGAKFELLGYKVGASKYGHIDYLVTFIDKASLR